MVGQQPAVEIIPGVNTLPGIMGHIFMDGKRTSEVPKASSALIPA